MVAGRDADRLGKGPHRAGQFQRHAFAPRRGRVGARAANVRSSPHGRRGAFLALFIRLPPPHGGGFLAFQLPLLAAAERGGLALFLFFGSAGRTPRRGRSRPGMRRDARAGRRRFGVLGQSLAALRRQTPLFVLADMLGQRLRARLAGSDRVRGELQIGLLRGRLRRFRAWRQPAAGRQRRQLDRRSSVFLFSLLRPLFDLLFRLLLVLFPLLFPLLSQSARDSAGRAAWPGGRSAAAGGAAAGGPATAGPGLAPAPRLAVAARRRDLGRRSGLRLPPQQRRSLGGLCGKDRNLLVQPPCRPGRCSPLAGRPRRAAAGFMPQGRPTAARPAAFALVDKRGNDRRLFVGQTGQRRPLPRHTCLCADVGQHLAVELQLFR